MHSVFVYVQWPLFERGALASIQTALQLLNILWHGGLFQTLDRRGTSHLLTTPPAATTASLRLLSVCAEAPSICDLIS